MTDTPQTVGGSEYSSALDDKRMALIFKALGHPARIAILRAICPRERVCCGEIVDALPLAQSTVSQHLQILCDAGLIKGEIEGRRSCYCIDGATISVLAATATTLFGDLERAAQACRKTGSAEGTCCVTAQEGVA